MTIEEFMNVIMQISPQNISAYGGGMPGMTGGVVNTMNAAESGATVALQLQRQAVEMAKAYVTKDRATLAVAAKEITGSIMVVHTLGIISEEQADELLDALQQFKKELN